MKYAQNFQAQRETVFPFQNPRQRVDAVKNNSSDNAEVFPPEISTLDGMQLNSLECCLFLERSLLEPN